MWCARRCIKFDGEEPGEAKLARNSSGDAFAEFDQLVENRGYSTPWDAGVYVPDMDLLRDLLTLPISQGDKQESGRPAKALDAWIAHELRRSGFDRNAVWPRARKPRVLAEGLDHTETKLETLASALSAHENSTGKRLKPDQLRKAIREATESLPGSNAAYVLGDFYAKQIDVGLSSWQRGPDILISTKTMFGSYRKNLRNRHEEAIGEVSSLRKRHPMAVIGFVYLVRSDILEEEGAYPILIDILTRLRRPNETFDATMLLVANWSEEVPNPIVNEIDQPAEHLSASRFFIDVITASTERTPIAEHRQVRLLRDGEPVGGMPDEDEMDVDSEGN
jgi:hypothetical protein